MFNRKNLAIGVVAFIAPVAAVAQNQFGGCSLFPPDHVYNTRIDNLPVHPNSATYIAELGGNAHPEWGSSVPGEYPVNIVHGNSIPPAIVNINWPFTSDSGPFPIPANAVIGDSSDHHLIVVDVDNCVLYEAFQTAQNGDGSFTVNAISTFNLNSYALKPADWSSSNAAGTAQLPLLVRYDEVAAGQINHAISMTGAPTGNSYVWPASHSASSNPNGPPMGTRFRLKASYDISGLGPQAQVVAQALKTYGAILTDNGASFFLLGVPDSRFNDDDLHGLTHIPGGAFEAVDESSLEKSATSGQIATSTTSAPATWMNVISKNSGKCLDVMGISTAPGALLQQWTCWGGDNQKFQFAPVQGGFEITAKNSGLQLDVNGGPGATWNGDLIIQYPFWGGTNEIWQLNPTGDGYYTITAVNSGSCLDVTGISIWDGALVQQWSCWGGDNQKWQLVPTQ